ncbi:MAG: hypothetical protein EKK33_23775 [Bradyrhizobiaceae bacterium]|nr:MAG: hypothetical protein EKK33_23775 [Bradyrhizobiaceae bacterium]
MKQKEREQLRRDLTHLLTESSKVILLEPEAAALVAEFIDNYEFGLAYEIMIEQLKDQEIPFPLQQAAIKMKYQQD